MSGLFAPGSSDQAPAPVRPGRDDGGLPLWPAIAGRLATRQLWIELYGLPAYGQTLNRPKTQGFAATPRDFRPCDAAGGRLVLNGRFMLAGSGMDAPPPSDPWDRPSPTKAFATDLHAYRWLPSLMLSGERGAREALRLTLAWDDHFRRWAPFAWGPEILARRVFNLACAARRMAATGTEVERQRLGDILARQARQLLRPPGGLAGRAERLTAAAVAGCALAGAPGVSLRKAALGRLPGALKATVDADGGHASRSAEAGMELLLDLLTLDDALLQLNEGPPPALGEAIGRLTMGLRALTLPDGRLISAQGGGPSDAARVAAARAHDDGQATPPGGRVAGYARIASPLLTIVADAARPARGAWSGTACAQSGALEIVCGRDRLITNSGWNPRAADRQALRLTPAGSTLSLGDGSIAEPLGGWKGELLDARLEGPPSEVTVEHREAEGAVWLEIEHDGWVRRYGLRHQRRLYLDQRLDELRAEERLYPAPGVTAQVRALAAPYAVRFHLEPTVTASLARDRRSILLRGHSGRGWWFRSDAPDVAIEPSIHVEDGLTRRTLQLVLRGSARTDGESKIRWKLNPAGGAGDPV